MTFTEIGRRLGAHLKRIPDGEIGARAHWIYWQRAKAGKHPAMEVVANENKARFHRWDGKFIREWDLFRFRAGVDPATIEFGSGCAPEAIASYARFVAMRRAGTLPTGARFQVCLPTLIAALPMSQSRSPRTSPTAPRNSLQQTARGGITRRDRADSH